MTRRAVLAAAGVSMLALVAGCGSSSSGGSPAASSASAAASTGSGAVSVLHAGSLVSLVDMQIGPAFQKATHYTFNGFGEDSQSLANEIKARTKTGDVYISASPTVNASLEGASNGSWVSWYATFATSPVVIAYNPKSSFAKDFKTMPWYKVLALPGIKLGRTDPTLDPKGALTVAALKQAVTTYGLPASFPAAVEKKAAVFPETELQGRLQAGQIDAGFFYTDEAVPLHLTTVSLGKVHESAAFTVTVLNRAKNPVGGAAFVNYLLTTAKATLNANGLDTVTPTVTGDTSAVPAALRADLGLS